MFLKSALLASTLIVAAPLHDPPPVIELGTGIPSGDVKMLDVTGKEYSLNELKGTNGLAVIFSCNTCPFVVGSEGSEGWEGRYPALGTFCKKNNVGFALVNSNEGKRADVDSHKEMQLHFRAKGYVGNYLVDANSALADAFGARTTPHVFLFDKNGKLVYRGAIDDNVDSAKAVKEHYLQNALDALVAGKPIAVSDTRNLGCSIKRVHTH